MSKIELTISPNYVPKWTYVDAIRELFQNALDQETQNPDNKASWNYNESTGQLTISNKTSKLDASSLLLGQSTKADDKATIGQFGEGYKIAALVLLREGKTITFYNSGAKEIWRPRFVKSRRFGTNILTFFTEKIPVWERKQSSDLDIVIGEITMDEYYNHIVPSNLRLRTDYEVIEKTEYGEILDLPGQVYVNGLFICQYAPYKYGYNFKPKYISLDRDRKMVNNFDLEWMASKMWLRSVNEEKVLNLILEGYADVAYINNTGTADSRWNNMAYDRFRSKYGMSAVPVSTQAQLSSVPAGYKGVVVSDQYRDLIINCSLYVEPESSATALDKLQAWYEEVYYYIRGVDRQKFEKIMEELRNEQGM